MSTQKPKAPEEPIPLPAEMPPLPAPVKEFLQYVGRNPGVPVRQLMGPFLEYESVLRAYFAQAPDHEFVQGRVNLISLFEDSNADMLRVRARSMANESKEEEEKYVMVLDDKVRKDNGDRILVGSLEEFKNNFNIFSEGSLLNLDWSNIIAAGSSVMTPLLKVPQKHAKNKKTLRDYYHEKLAPASDIDLFIHGIEDPAEAIKKMAAIEDTVRNNLLWETTTIRTRNTVTIVSQYPNRHVQIVLRLYKSPAQILAGFDVPCSCFAYDGQHVLSNPRGIAACVTQCNDVDLSRRSPSYESRLSKYSHRGFEVYCDFLDRSLIDPSIFERSFARTVGLARLLVLEALPKPQDRDSYMERRRCEMGRPYNSISTVRVTTDIKTQAEDEVAEWDFQDVSSYQKFTIPYGPEYNAKRTEKMFFKKDLLLNAEWNPVNNPPNRTVALHRHPVFFGTVKDVVVDCCGFCPIPLNDEDRKVFEEEEKTFVTGPITFLSDDPGRQEIGSFYPLTPDDYTDMAYVSLTGRLCEAIVDNDVPYVVSWSVQEGVNLDSRDFCGRTPLQLACMSTSTELEIVQTLVNAGARLVARMQDGRTALHLAAARGRADIVRVLLGKSAQNEQERDEKEDKRKEAEKAIAKDERLENDEDIEGSDGESDKSYDNMSDDDSATAGTNTTHGFVKIGKDAESNILDGDNVGDDDIYDINIIDWDNGMSPLHHAILGGHEEVVEALVSGFGADVLLPIKIYQHHNSKYLTDAILNLVLALRLKDTQKRAGMAEKLLKLGASSAQANSIRSTSALHYTMLAGCTEVLDKMFELDGPSAMSVINSIANGQDSYRSSFITPLITALVTSKNMVGYILDHGAHGTITIEDYMQILGGSLRNSYTGNSHNADFGRNVMQPIEMAIVIGQTCEVVARLIAAGADPSTITQATWAGTYYDKLPVAGNTVLESIRAQIKRCQEFLVKEREKVPEFKERVIFGPEVLDAFEPGSYQRFCAEQQFVAQNKARKTHNMNTEKKVTDMGIIALQKKIAAVKGILESLRATEKTLVNAGAKTYYELFPEKLELAQKKQKQEQLMISMHPLIQPLQLNMSAHLNLVVVEDTDHIFSVNNYFSAPYLGKGDIQAAYLRLFEAIWRGTPEDANLVKALTLSPTSEGDMKLPALRISVADHQGYTTLWLALYRRNWDMARLILAIVNEQYDPPKASSKERRYVLEPREDEDCNSETSRDEIHMNDFITEFTIENIGIKRDLLKCSVSPYGFLVMKLMPEVLLGDEENMQRRKSVALLENSGWTPLSYAIYKNDMELFRFIISLLAGTKDDAVVSYIDINYEHVQPGQYFHSGFHLRYGAIMHLRLALVLGRIEMLEEIMKTVAFGIPWAELEEADEELQMEKPQFYKGLTVYGVKRKDWASSSYPAHGTNSDKIQKPVQTAAFFSQLESIKWLLSDRPFQCLKGFMDAHPDTMRTKLLKKQGDGLGFLLQKGLGVETTLLPYLAIKGWAETYSMETFRFLLSRPGAIEARTNLHMNLPLYAAQVASANGYNTALIAELRKPEYEADFAARDSMGRNIVHHILLPRLHRGRAIDKEILTNILELLPSDVMETAWTQRMLGTSQTPLAYWLRTQNSQVDIPVLRLILKYSKGRDLGIANSEGNLPIHWAYLNGHHRAARIITKMAPQYIHTENANGRTPVEIATSRYLQDVRENPPLPPSGYMPQSYQTAEDALSFKFHLEEDHEKKKQIALLEDRGDQMEVDGQEEAEEDHENDPVVGYDSTAVEDMYHFAVAAERSFSGKRKLVSLAEANELAKRITSGAGQAVEFDGGDILSLW